MLVSIKSRRLLRTLSGLIWNFINKAETAPMQVQKWAVNFNCVNLMVIEQTVTNQDEVDCLF